MNYTRKMNEIIANAKYYIRTHFVTFSHLYSMLRQGGRNLKFRLKCYKLGEVKKTDTFFFVIVPTWKHPGFADRLKAIVAAYNQAKKNNLKFKIIFKIPFVLEEYLMPSPSCDWIADFDDLEYSFNQTRFVNERPGWRLNAHKGKQYHCYNYAGSTLPEIFEDTGFKWHELFSELFVPNEEIQSAINGTGFKAKSYIAIHLRFVNALDNFELGYDNGLKNERQKEDLIYRCKSAIQSITDKAGNKRVLVFSDSKRFLMSLADLPVTILDPSAIGHISFSGAHNQIAKTFLDFYMIARAAKVYRIAAKEMYLSSCFAMCAARAGNAEYFSVIV